ncbi:MAG: glycyl-radical enzyme activating protein [Eubacteriales bacterium]|nr:glycyl-radical enzyme activating protein [Eubacteriales bacterium]
MKGTILNIQRFSVHDGPNIRTTVFLKGCPLRCEWCHNPESLKHQKEIMWDKSSCVFCMKCIEVCPCHAITFDSGLIITNYEQCEHCGDCSLYCQNSARQLVGKDFTVDDLVKEVLKDKIIFQQSGGGVTFSGGEPLAQIDFLHESMKSLKEHDIHIAIDTSGYTPYDCFERIIGLTDLFLYDIKMSDDVKHQRYTGVSNKPIIDNLMRLSKEKVDIILRLPILEGINDTDQDINGILKIADKACISHISILPYHSIGQHKYPKLGLVYRYDSFKTPSQDNLEKIKNIFDKNGYKTQIGG